MQDSSSLALVELWRGYYPKPNNRAPSRSRAYGNNGRRGLVTYTALTRDGGAEKGERDGDERARTRGRRGSRGTENGRRFAWRIEDASGVSSQERQGVPWNATTAFSPLRRGPVNRARGRAGSVVLLPVVVSVGRTAIGYSETRREGPRVMNRLCSPQSVSPHLWAALRRSSSKRAGGSGMAQW